MTDKKKRERQMAVVLGLALMIGSPWATGYLAHTLAEWTYIPLLITGAIWFLIGIVFVSGGLSDEADESA